MLHNETFKIVSPKFSTACDPWLKCNRAQGNAVPTSPKIAQGVLLWTRGNGKRNAMETESALAVHSYSAIFLLHFKTPVRVTEPNPNRSKVWLRHYNKRMAIGARNYSSGARNSSPLRVYSSHTS